MSEKLTEEQKKAAKRLSEAGDEIEAARSAYLRAHGWHHTSDTPGFFWLWQKEIPSGRVALLEEGMAITVQQHLTPPDISDICEGDNHDGCEGCDCDCHGPDY